MKKTSATLSEEADRNIAEKRISLERTAMRENPSNRASRRYKTAIIVNYWLRKVKFVDSETLLLKILYFRKSNHSA